MANSVMASQKRKLDVLSKLQPVLNTSSKDDISCPLDVSQLQQKQILGDRNNTFSLDEVN